MEKKIKIDVPEGMQVDMDSIKFKPIQKKRFIDDKNALIDGFWIEIDSEILHTVGARNRETNYNVFATEKQAKSALAMARISQIMANDPRFGGAITAEEWGDYPLVKYCIRRWQNRIETPAGFYGKYHFLAFHTKKQCELFLQENEQLIKDYLMID